MVIRKLLRGERQPFVYSVLAVVVATLFVVMIGFFFVKDQVEMSEARQREAERVNDQRWCSLLVQLDDSYRENYGRLTPTGKAVADQIHSLRGQFGCGITPPLSSPGPRPSSPVPSR